MIEVIKKIDLKNETRPIIVAKNEGSKEYKELDNYLLNGLSNVDKKGVVWTLNQIASPKIHLYLNEKGDIKDIASLEGDFVILVDSFVKDNDINKFAYELSLAIASNEGDLTLKSDAKEVVKNFYLYSSSDIETSVNEGNVVGQSISLTKKLINLPPNYLNASQLAQIANDYLLGEMNVELTILGKKDLQDLKMGAFLAVNQGSYEEPKLIAIKYQGLDKFEDPTTFVGKGVMFDTGGYSLKQRMNEMKSDMAGGAAVLGAAIACVKLGLKVNALFLIGATDNRLGEYAILPDDVITAMSGKTIEIFSTDAEGRLVLADVLTYAQTLGAKRIIDIATLTGSMVATLGTFYTGAYTNDQGFYDSFKAVTDKTAERIWQMPLDEAYFSNLRSKVADMKNSGGRTGGASSAALFLSKFINSGTSWIHLDIAGTSYNDERASGVMVRSFVEFLKTK